MIHLSIAASWMSSVSPYCAGSRFARTFPQTILRPIYEQMFNDHEKETAAARERAMISYEARQRAIGRIGLETVRQHRRRKLAEAHARRLAEIASGAKTLPILELIAAAQVIAA